MKKIKKNTLSDILKQSRNKLNMSQGDLAKTLGYTSPQFISNWERGISSPPLKTICKLVNVLSLDPDEVIEVMLIEEEKTLRKALETRARKYK
ncbi:MAG: helix-turn-helix transcriptional regulator [Bdellovibrionales bacterium]|nr:helix-turn-helix transcriptional regulator [Bdellovibrionales bacterium]